MRILKKISLHRGLHRIQQPAPNYPKLTASKLKMVQAPSLTPSQQLHKYGVKPKYIELKWFFGITIGFFAAAFFRAYVQEMYKNELDTIYRYRWHQDQNSTIKLRTRVFLMKIFQFLEGNFMLSGFFSSKNLGGAEMSELTEAYLRYGQYENYMKNKDKKFDFLDIGILDKFPYAKPVKKME